MLLENPTGPYAVGATTFSLPVKPTRVFGTATVRSQTGGLAPALQLEEVCFTVYYPVSRTVAESGSKKWFNWFPRYVLHCIGFELVGRGSSRLLADHWHILSKAIPATQVS
jgi:hypothetical protein